MKQGLGCVRSFLPTFWTQNNSSSTHSDLTVIEDVCWVCGISFGPRRLLPPGAVSLRSRDWWDHHRGSVPLLMRRGGRFSKATHASLEVLVSCVVSWLPLQWLRLYLKLSFSSSATEGNVWRKSTFFFIFRDINYGHHLWNIKGSLMLERSFYELLNVSS